MNEHENRRVKTDWKISGFADEISDDLRQQIDSFRRLGISFMEMRGVDGNNLIYHSDEKVREIKKRLDDAGIRLSACGSPLGKIDISDPFPPHLESLKRAIDVAHRMGCDNIRMFSFYMPAEQRAACRSAVFDRIGQMVRCAEENGAVLLHENEKGIYGEMAAECRQLMDAFYGSHFKAIFDFANFVQAGQDTQEAFRLLRPFIAYVHVKDALAENGNVVPAGMGDGHVAEILAELAGAGFDGFLSIEPHLAHFAGFDLLEKNGVSVAKGTPPLEGFDAFELAHRSLLRILDGRTGESHGWRPGRARAQGGPAETDNTTRKTQSAARLTCRSGSGPKGGIVMSERNTERKEKDWTDEIPDEEDSLPEPYEETYRDGSAKNECWGEQ